MAGKEGSSNSTIITSPSVLSKPLNLMQAISEIQQFASIEKNMNEKLDSNYFPIGARVDFLSVGIKNSLTHLLFSLFLTPITIGVLDRIIPLFGEKTPGLFEEIYAILLAFSISIGFGLFLVQLKNSYVGVVSKSMIKNLLGGLLIGEIFKVFICAIIYNTIYVYLTDIRILKFVYYLKQHTVMEKWHIHIFHNYYGLYEWILKFREVFPLSTVFVLLSSLFIIVPPIVAIMINSIKSKKTKDFF
ncbi:MAG: hypothetical protein QXH07_05410 [Thermoplasmata archaeon]